MKKFKHLAVSALVLAMICSLIFVFGGCSSSKDETSNTKPNTSASSDDKQNEPEKPPETDKDSETKKPETDKKDDKDIAILPSDNEEKQDEIDEATYSFDYDTDEYTVEHSDGADKYVFENMENTYVEVKFINNSYPDELAPSFLDGYINYTSIEYCGVSQVGNSDEMGELIVGSNSDTTVSAYLIETANGTLAIIISQPTDAQTDIANSLNEIIDSLEVQYF